MVKKKFDKNANFFFNFQVFAFLVKGALPCQFFMYTVEICHINVFLHVEQVLFFILIKNVKSLVAIDDLHIFMAAIFDFLRPF